MTNEYVPIETVDSPCFTASKYIDPSDSLIGACHVLRMVGKKAMRSIIVYGPPGCGKTMNAERIRKALDLKRVEDELAPRERFDKDGVLYLTNMFPPNDGSRTVWLTYEDAMTKVDQYERPQRGLKNFIKKLWKG